MTKISFYLKILPQIIKNKKINEFNEMRKERDQDKDKRKRGKEYLKLSTSSENIFMKLFPNQKLPDLETCKEIDNHVQKFCDNQNKIKPNTKENPYPIDFGLDLSTRHFLFTLCYLAKPKIVVETGVANGFSSTYILYALRDIDNSKLISIEKLFFSWHTKEGVGLSIPKNLKNKHILKIGAGRDELAAVDEKIDIFIHDSFHTYDTMLNEFKIAWPKIRVGGILCSDDASNNDAFLDFADSVNMKPLIISRSNNRQFGIIQKLT